MIHVYTDGSSRGNPGPGGYGTILVYQGHEKVLAQGYRMTTNNRMELLAVIKGLEALTKPHQDVRVYADSKYVVDAVQKRWVMKWERQGFDKKKNADLWRRFLKVYRQHNVTFVWVRGHAGHTYNERCDTLATEAACQGPWDIDAGYEVLHPPSPTT